MTNIEKGIWVAIVVLVVAMVFGFTELQKQHDAFVAECKQDRKAYECEAMWKAGHPDPNIVYVVH